MLGEPDPREEHEHAQILADLAAAGYDIDDLSSLASTGRRYRELVPVLVCWLRKASSAKNKEWLVRGLSVSWAKAAGPDLIVEFHALRGNDATSLGWVIGNALSVIADESLFDALVEISEDRSWGRSRQMVVLGLGNIRTSESRDTLIGLLDDPDVAGHAIMALGKIRDPAAAESVRPFLAAEKTWIRKEAGKALKRMGCDPSAQS
jgi:hypothetical protein